MGSGKKIWQHPPIRTPSGWNEQEKSTVRQIDELISDLYRRVGRVRFEDLAETLQALITGIQTGTLTDVAYGSAKLTKTKNGTTTDVVSAATLKADMALDQVENKSSADIRGELTGTNVTDALGYTPYDAANPAGYTDNVGTITGITMNGASKGNSGVVDLGTVITAHQDISGKADKSTTVTNVSYDTTNKKIQKTINGSTTDVVTVATIKGDLGSFTWGQLAGQ